MCGVCGSFGHGYGHPNEALLVTRRPGWGHPPSGSPLLWPPVGAALREVTTARASRRGITVIVHHSFTATIEANGKGAKIGLPFDPNEVWGTKERHHVRGTIRGCVYRGELVRDGSNWIVKLGPAWVRDNLAPGAVVEVTLAPEGPNLAPDLVAALAGSAKAKAFFESLPTFYRNNFVRWIEQAKRPEARAKRIAETVRLCESGQRER